MFLKIFLYVFSWSVLISVVRVLSFSIPLIFLFQDIWFYIDTHTKIKEEKKPHSHEKNPAGFGSISNHAITELTCSIGTITISWLRPNFRNIEININDGIRHGPIHADYKKVIQKGMFFSSITCIEIYDSLLLLISLNISIACFTIIL